MRRNFRSPIGQPGFFEPQLATSLFGFFKLSLRMLLLTLFVVLVAGVALSELPRR